MNNEEQTAQFTFEDTVTVVEPWTEEARQALFKIGDQAFVGMVSDDVIAVFSQAPPKEVAKVSLPRDRKGDCDRRQKVAMDLLGVLFNHGLLPGQGDEANNADG